MVQKNLVFVVGLSPRLAEPEILKKADYFGKFGRIQKVVINHSTQYAGSQVQVSSYTFYYTNLCEFLSEKIKIYQIKRYRNFILNCSIIIFLFVIEIYFKIIGDRIRKSLVNNCLSKFKYAIDPVA